MKTTALIWALATSAYAWTYPNCKHDGCYRNLVDPRYIAQAPAFCIGWISDTTTNTGAIPTQYHNCPGVAPLSSACSCIAYTVTRTDCIETGNPPLVTTSSKSGTTTLAPPCTVSSETTERSTEIETSTPPTTIYTTLGLNTAVSISLTTQVESSNVSTRSPTLTTAPWTTLTIFTASTHTVIKCHTQATNCPVESTVVLTSTILHLTIVYPATSTEPLPLSLPHFQSSTKKRPPQSSECPDGLEHGHNGDCTPVTPPSSQRPHSPPGTTQLTATATSTRAPPVLRSSNPDVTAGVGRFGIETAAVVVGVASVPLQVVESSVIPYSDRS